jgi:hypothetical protein
MKSVTTAAFNQPTTTAEGKRLAIASFAERSLRLISQYLYCFKAKCHKTNRTPPGNRHFQRDTSAQYSMTRLGRYRSGIFR